MKTSTFRGQIIHFVRPVFKVGKMMKLKLQKALEEETQLGKKMTIELALLQFAPEPPPNESSCLRMIAVILVEGLLDRWPEDVQQAWFDHLQKNCTNCNIK